MLAKKIQDYIKKLLQFNSKLRKERDSFKTMSPEKQERFSQVELFNLIRVEEARKFLKV